MTTPEGTVKAKVKKLLMQYKPRLYTHWPVMNGMGEPTLDCLGAIEGRMFAIETKAPGKKPTPRQEETIRKMREGGIVVFVVDGVNGELEALDTWLCTHYMTTILKGK